MSAACERRVHHLRLRTPAELAERARFQIEDALRTASLRDNPRELILVRRLDLGRIRADAPPGVIARLLEQRWSEMEVRVGQWTGEADPDAPAVRFPSLHAALVAFAREVAGGRTPTEWFWRGVLFGEHRAPLPMDRRAAAWAVARRVIEGAGAPGIGAGVAGPPLIAVAALLADLLETDDALPFVALLDRPVAEILLAELGIQAVPASSSAGLSREAAVALARLPEIRIPAAWRKQLHDAAERLTIADPRVRLLAAAAICARQPWRAAEVRLLAAEIARVLETVPAARTVPDATPHKPHEAAARQGAPESAKAGPGVAESQLAPVVAPSATSPPAVEQTGAAETASPWTTTSFAGLYFLAVAFQRLGGAARPGAGMTAVHVLVGLARWAGAADVDPVLAPLLAAELPPADKEDVALWSRAVRRFLRRKLRLRWMAVVTRPGRIAWTRTHIDVAFDLRQADVRIRRAGLDINPGWAPWLGRVVSFHYGDV